MYKNVKLFYVHTITSSLLSLPLVVGAGVGVAVDVVVLVWVGAGDTEGEGRGEGCSWPLGSSDGVSSSVLVGLVTLEL